MLCATVDSVSQNPKDVPILETAFIIIIVIIIIIIIIIEARCGAVG